MIIRNHKNLIFLNFNHFLLNAFLFSLSLLLTNCSRYVQKFNTENNENRRKIILEGFDSNEVLKIITIEEFRFNRFDVIENIDSKKNTSILKIEKILEKQESISFTKEGKISEQQMTIELVGKISNESEKIYPLYISISLPYFFIQREGLIKDLEEKEIQEKVYQKLARYLVSETKFFLSKSITR